MIFGDKDPLQQKKSSYSHNVNQTEVPVLLSSQTIASEKTVIGVDIVSATHHITSCSSPNLAVQVCF